LPQRPVLLTFDDGYLDHFTNVFPLLDEMGVQGSFFPPARAVMDHKVLDVNKIHFILASVEDKRRIIDAIFSMMDEARGGYDLETNEVFFRKLAQPNRFDPGEVIFIKRALQRDLPERLRKTILERLFIEFVTRDEPSFAMELYLSPDQLKCMRRNGMYVGSHGYDHVWLDTLEAKEQEKEVEKSLDFLKTVGCEIGQWAMCYPYGGYNDSLLEILRRKGCKVGLTTRVGVADLSNESPLLLSRIDTNDLPKKADAGPNDWTLKAIQESGR
jgi:peptidoglycan/xylan/chitin deacetylase (PgdA/CDA1 family)